MKRQIAVSENWNFFVPRFQPNSEVYILEKVRTQTPCNECNGRGRVAGFYNSSDGAGMIEMEGKCPICKGVGSLFSKEKWTLNKRDKYIVKSVEISFSYSHEIKSIVQETSYTVKCMRSGCTSSYIPENFMVSSIKKAEAKNLDEQFSEVDKNEGEESND